MNPLSLFSIKGRVSREQFWLTQFLIFCNVNSLVGLSFYNVLILGDASFFNSNLYVYWFLFMLLHVAHGICRQIKRGHDLGFTTKESYHRTDLLFFTKEDMVGDNEYGPDPKKTI